MTIRLASPPALAVLEDGRGQIKQAETLLNARKVDEALQVSSNAYENLALQLRDAGLTWQNAARGLADGLASGDGIPEAVSQQFAEHLKSAPLDLNRVKEDGVKAETAALKQLLDDLGTERRGYAERMTELKLRMQQEWTTFENAWRPAATALPNPKELDHLKEQFLDFAQEVALAADDPGALRSLLPQKCADLQKNWHDSIVHQVPAGNAALPQILKLIKEHKFIEAANAMLPAAGIQVTWGSAPTTSAAPEWPEFRLALPLLIS
jgi:hypothetical protein